MRESSEVELKYLLESDADLEKLAAGLPGFESELKQQNIYLDQNGMLREQGVLLRIRLENGTGEVTIKKSGGISDGVSMALESSEELTGPLFRKSRRAISWRLWLIWSAFRNCTCLVGYDPIS